MEDDVKWGFEIVRGPYTSLGNVLNDAFTQAAEGKGKERHACDNKFEDQLICQIQRMLKDHPFGGQAFQAIKKTIEAGRLYKISGSESAKAEILGAMNYLAAMVILIEEE